MQRTEYLSDLRQDVTFALRTLRRDKGWTTVTILTLTLGIAAATAVFAARHVPGQDEALFGAIFFGLALVAAVAVPAGQRISR